MNVSLEQRTSIFENLQWKHVITLGELLQACDLLSLDYIKKRYIERGAHFMETVSFLKKLGLLKQMKGTLTIQEKFFRIYDANLHSMILDQLISSKTQYSSEVAHYMGKYTLIERNVSYRPNKQVISEESAVRNFLMEMGVIKYVHHEDSYVVSPEYLNFYFQMRDMFMYCTPARVAKDLEARNKIGLMAEKAVIAYEKERVGDILSRRVRHIALNNAAAGYDILSVAAETLTDTTPRYIEVKAVSSTSFQFYWTQNEIQMAHMLGPLYYLYLVPIEANHKIRRDLFMIIPYAYANVLGSGNKWIVKPDVLLCQPESIHFLQNQLLEV
jgi:hypothetical protein